MQDLNVWRGIPALLCHLNLFHIDQPAWTSVHVDHSFLGLHLKAGESIDEDFALRFKAGEGANIAGRILIR